MAVQAYEITKTRANPGYRTAGDPITLHEVATVGSLAEADAGVAWQYVGHGVFCGNNGEWGPRMVTYYARPTDR